MFEDISAFPFYHAHILKHIFALSKISWLKSTYLVHKNQPPTTTTTIHHHHTPCPALPNGPVRAFSTSMQQLFRCKLAV